MTKEEVVTAIRECAEKIGHAPSVRELRQSMRISNRSIRKNFGTYKRAIEACGLKRQGPGYQVSLDLLFVEWASMVRRLGRIPTVTEWDRYAQYSVRPLMNRFNSWKYVPQGLLDYAKREGLESEWKDVLEISAADLTRRRLPGWTFDTPSDTVTKARVLINQPIYGAPLLPSPLTCAPTNEMGVVFLFGALARDLGYAMTRLQPEYPDGEGWRRIDENRWQRVRIEFEFESRNFVTHFHQVEDCDVIVCWNHNWPECPLDVVELRAVVGSGDRRDRA